MRRSTGANQLRPCRVPYPRRGVADGKKISEEGETWRQVDRSERGGGCCLHTSSDKAKTVKPSHHTSFLCLRLLPVCPSLSTAGPQGQNLNDERGGKRKASAFRMSGRHVNAPCNRTLTFPAPLPFITLLNLAMREASEL